MSSDLSQGLQDGQVASFVEQLRVARYAEWTIRKRRSVAIAFAQWTRRKRLTFADLDESQVTKFLGRTPRPSKHRIALERASVRLFLRHLRPDGRPPPRKRQQGQSRRHPSPPHPPQTPNPLPSPNHLHPKRPPAHQTVVVHHARLMPR